jgi:hypothetical protein
MEPLAYVEVVDRHRDIVARHAIYRWPARIGRGYEADVILDDPYVAPEHVTLEPIGGERFRLTDLGTQNGIVLDEAKEREVEVGSDELVRLGHTQIRIRTRGHAVAQERPVRTIELYRRPLPFFVAAALAIGLVIWNGWIMTTEEREKYWMLFAVVGLVVVAGTWIAAWSFQSHAIGRGPNFFAHGFIAFAGIVALGASEALFEYLSFALDAGWLAYVAGIASAVIFAYMVYRHLLLNSRARRRSLAYTSAGVSVAVTFVFAAMSLAGDLAYEGKQRYNDAIKTPAVLLRPGTTAEAFLTDAHSLKGKVDAMRKPEE